MELTNLNNIKTKPSGAKEELGSVVGQVEQYVLISSYINTHDSIIIYHVINIHVSLGRISSAFTILK